jgi:GH15 family glucan-1,4-alpha-glucosidase
MASRIEDYALLGDCQTAALVGRDGSIDWLCLPRFDSGACFAALLGAPENGRWKLAPKAPPRSVTRAYRDGSLVLDTTFRDGDSEVTITDCMPLRDRIPRIVRTVRGVRGRTAMQMELVIRFDYGSIVPWVRKAEGRHGEHGIRAIAGPDSLHLHSQVPLRGENLTTVAEFEVAEGQELSFVLGWHPSHVQPSHDVDPRKLVAETERAWREWAAQCTYEGPWREAVMRSLVVLKALTHTATGGIVAAATTSLPEALGGPRNWDYRYCWVRDATFTLLALLHNGFLEEAKAWREWLLRAVAGDASELQIMYAVDGERRLGEEEIPWLPGYERSAPVRVGNGAYRQRQLDVYGEVMDALFQCHVHGLPGDAESWNLRRGLLEFLETCWDQEDEGIWEVRGPARHFTHSKVMAWVAFDRGVRRLEALAGTHATGGVVDGPRAGPLERWRVLRDRMHETICRSGYDPDIGAFVQSYGSRRLDASLLMIPLVGFLPIDDPRVQGTVRAIEEHLIEGGLVRRYDSDRRVDGLAEGEGTFLPCSFWLADNWALMGQTARARRLFERLVGLSNDVGLLAEEYDVKAGRLLGNFPQAFSHVSLVNSALNLGEHGGRARHARHAR